MCALGILHPLLARRLTFEPSATAYAAPGTYMGRVVHVLHWLVDQQAKETFGQRLVTV